MPIFKENMEYISKFHIGRSIEKKEKENSIKLSSADFAQNLLKVKRPL